MTVGDGSRLLARHRLSVRDMVAIEHRPPHLYERLWRLYLRTRSIVILISPIYFVLFAGRRDPSRTITLLTTRYGSGVLDMYGRKTKENRSCPLQATALFELYHIDFCKRQILATEAKTTPEKAMKISMVLQCC